MKTLQIVLFALFSFVLTACATPPQASGLTSPAKEAEIELKSHISYRRVAGLLNVEHEEGLVPGVYVAEKQNEHGTFFRGPGRCVLMHNSLQPEFTMVRPGGIWIPHNANGAPKLYYYLEASIYRVQNVDDYIAGRQAGQGTAVTTEVGGPIVSPLSNALVAISLDANKDVPNLNFDIVDQAFVQAVKNGYRVK